MAQRTVAVAGGGWAGLAAAIEATLLGDAVTLFEMAPQLGGRARRIDSGGLALDNGQHILIGAYTETLRLMQVVGVDPAAAFVRTPLCLKDPQGQGLRLPPGPPMLAFVRGVLDQRGWTWGERLRLLGAAAGWGRRGFECDAALSVGALTATLPAALRRDLIEPLCVAALNTPADQASAAVFLRVIRDALFAGPGSADLMLPRMRLSDLLPAPAARWLERSGASIQFGRRVDTVSRRDAGWSVDGARFDRVVIATSAVEAARLIQPLDADWARTAAALRYEPIVTVYAHSEGTRLTQPMLALRSDDTQWPAQFVFDQGQLGGPAGLLAFVISGAQGWLDRGLKATRLATLAQAKTLLGTQLKAPLRIVRDLTEKRATFRCTPALLRPIGRIAPGLVVAGDYVAGPYPATLEGAVRSGVAVARD